MSTKIVIFVIPEKGRKSRVFFIFAFLNRTGDNTSLNCLVLGLQGSSFHAHFRPSIQHHTRMTLSNDAQIWRGFLVSKIADFFCR